MTHDPLCPRSSHDRFCEGCTPQCGTCQCDLIAKVRADESAKYAFIELAKTDDRSTVISLRRRGEHVDYCRDLACCGCEEITEGVIAQML